MFRHALKLIWNRRRANALVMVEIATAFIVTFVLLALSVHFWSNYQRPLGFEYDDVWGVTIQQDFVTGSQETRRNSRRTLDEVIAALRALPRTQDAHVIRTSPFTGSSWSTEDYGAEPGATFTTTQNAMTAEALRTLGVRPVEGRLFGPQDETEAYLAALVNRAFVERAFGHEVSPLGKNISRYDSDVRVVGVIDDFRQFGEFADEQPLAIVRDKGETAGDVFLKVAPGTDAAFEEQIVATFSAIAPDWVVAITPWERNRESMHARTLTPLKAGATVGGFMLLMVVLGLIGVLWQDVVRRTQEIGLRRAVGAGAAGIRRQIVLEMLIVGLFGVAAGTAIAVQIPLLGSVEQIGWSSALPGIALAAALILALVALSALYPSWLASRREPADALRYE